MKNAHWLSMGLILGLAACGGGGVKLDDLAGEVEDAQCDWQVRCGLLPDTASCATLEDASDDVAAFKAAIDAGRLKYDEGKAQDCVDAFRDADCSLFGALEAAGEACQEMFVGLVADGGTCYEDEECVSDNCGQTDPQCDMACCVGTCGPAETNAQIGEACGSGKQCVDGAHCAFDSATQMQKCAADIAEGGTCQFSGCADGLYCDTPEGQQMGTCKKPGATGAACNPQAFFGACAEITDWCNPATSKCEARKKVGEACDVELGNCLAYAYCNAGTCAANSGTGGTCASQGSGPDCLGALDCVDGTCQADSTATPICP